MTHGIRLLASEPTVEINGHFTLEEAREWAGKELLEKKRHVMDELPVALFGDVLEKLREGYGVRIVVIEPSHL